MLGEFLPLVSALVPVTASAAAPSPIEAQDATRPWTLLVYCAIDNNADGPCQEFLDDVRKAIDDDPAIDVLLLLDRSDGFSDEAKLCGDDFSGCRLYRMRRDSCERLAGGEHLPELTLDADPEVDSADPKLLRRFVAWGKATSPAKNTGLLIYSHASGEAMCPDEESRKDMYIPELTDCEAPKVHLEFLALELCNMSGLEIAYQWSPRRPGGSGFSADVLVAIPNAGPPLDWDRAFARVRSPGHAATVEGPTFDWNTITPEEFGKLVVAEGQAGRNAAKAMGRPVTHEAAACIDLHHAVAAKAAFDAFARSIAETNAKDVLLKFRGPGENAAMNYSGGGPYVDAFDLCLRAAKCEELSEETRIAAKTAMAAMDRLVPLSFGMEGYADFQTGRNGVFVVFPMEGRWRLFEWYTPFDGPGHAYGKWAFLKDGLTPKDGKISTWFELLDSWWDDNEDGDGGLNEYEP